MLNFVMVVGIPGAGKTRYTDVYKSNGYTVHSSDAIRNEILGDENNQNSNTDVFAVLHERVINDLKNGTSTVYDATNINWKRRRLFLDSIRKIDCKKTCIIFATSFKQCLKNNEERDRVVPEEVIARMYRQFSFPYYYEGWDEIEIVWNYEPSEFALEWDLGELNSFDQNTPHHTLTLGKHLEKAADYLKGKSENDYMYYVGYLHDIGKPFCEGSKFDEAFGVTKSTYYDHNATSAYDAMFYLKTFGFSDKDIIKMCAIIFWHMQPYFFATEKTENKYRNLWGENLYNDIMLLHEADLQAH